MPKFVVNSGLMSAGMDPTACAMGIPKMLKKQNIKGVSVDTCYCCGTEGKMVATFKAPSKEALSEALDKINFPVESIMEVKKELTPK